MEVSSTTGTTANASNVTTEALPLGESCRAQHAPIGNVRRLVSLGTTGFFPYGDSEALSSAILGLQVATTTLTDAVTSAPNASNTTSSSTGSTTSAVLLSGIVCVFVCVL